jgi:Ca2+-dependent lipid-binding protein
VANVRGKRAPYQLWQCILNVVVIEGQNLLSMDDNGLSDPYVKFKLENERFRSKTVRRTLNPRFMEQFQLYIYDMNKSTLQLTVYDHDSAGSADDFMGKAQINLKSLEYEKTHLVKLPLEDGAGSISLLLTITGTYGPDSPSDIEHYRENNKLTSAYRDEIIRQYVRTDFDYCFFLFVSFD